MINAFDAKNISDDWHKANESVEQAIIFFNTTLNDLIHSAAGKGDYEVIVDVGGERKEFIDKLVGLLKTYSYYTNLQGDFMKVSWDNPVV